MTTLSQALHTMLHPSHQEIINILDVMAIDYLPSCSVSKVADMMECGLQFASDADTAICFVQDGQTDYGHSLSQADSLCLQLSQLLIQSLPRLY